MPELRSPHSSVGHAESRNVIFATESSWLVIGTCPVIRLTGT